MLSSIYRLLTRTGKRDEVTEDMIRTFEDARAHAESRGRWSYLLFGIREIASQLGSPRRIIPRTRWTLILGGGMAGMALGAAASYLLPASYTSEASVLVVPAVIQDSLVANLDALGLGATGYDSHGLDLLRQEVTSRGRLAKLMVDYDLYPYARAGKPVDAIVRDMRKTIRIERSGDFSIRVAFTYWGSPDARKKAQKVTAELVAQFLDGAFHNQSNHLFQSRAFLSDLSDEAAKEWDELNRQSRGLTPADPRFARLTLDRELAQKKYESLRQKLAEVQGAAELENRQEGNKLEILDGASDPVAPDTSAAEMALYGLGCGLGAGLIAALWLTVRRVSMPMLTPEAATSH